MTPRNTFILLFVYISAWLPCLAQDSASAIIDPNHQASRAIVRQRIDGLYGRNLNRFALEQLRNYDRLTDTLFSIEKADTLAAIEEAFQLSSATKQNIIRDNKAEIKEFTASRDNARSTFYNLLRKSLFAFAVWLVIVFVIMRLRKKQLLKRETLLASAKIQEQATSGDFQRGVQLVRNSEIATAYFKNLSDSAGKVITTLKEAHENLSAGDDRLEPVKYALQTFIKIENAASREVLLSEKVQLQSVSAETEPVKHSVNELCDLYLEIASRGHCMRTGRELPCSVTRDLEKNLPSVTLHPVLVGSLLLNVLDNAFRSIDEKNALGIKGYLPKLSVSTRVLPRFVQIRIKDNGTGIPESVQQKMLEEFYSSRQEGQGAGLGLSESQRIISSLHNGEMKIESDPGNGTDVYIKFFT